jgi:hypothetical protein
VKGGEVKVALESTTIKIKEGSSSMVFSKYIGSEGGGIQDKDSRVSKKRVLVVERFYRT